MKSEERSYTELVFKCEGCGSVYRKSEEALSCEKAHSCAHSSFFYTMRLGHMQVTIRKYCNDCRRTTDEIVLSDNVFLKEIEPLLEQLMEKKLLERAKEDEEWRKENEDSN